MKHNSLLELNNLNKMKVLMNQKVHDEKLDQNEHLAKMRADTSIEKTVLSKVLNPKVEKHQ